MFTREQWRSLAEMRREIDNVRLMIEFLTPGGYDRDLSEQAAIVVLAEATGFIERSAR